MKKLSIALIVLSLFSCSKKDDPKTFYLSPNATINIRPNQLYANLKSTNAYLSALQIVKETHGIAFKNIAVYGDQNVSCGFANSLRDTLSNPPMLRRWATDLINRDGYGNYYIVPDFIGASDIVFFKLVDGGIDYYGKPCKTRDTVAYTPNSQSKKIWDDVKTALANKDTVLAYKAFNSWSFTPITGSEWRELKRQGKQ